MLFKYKATFKTWLRPGSPLVIQTRIVEAYDEDHVKILLTTWKTRDGIPLTKGLKEIDLDGYSGHHFDKSLYLVNKGFDSKHLSKLLEEIDSNKDFSPSKIIACGHNFESKMLMQVAENVKHYSNKKNIDVEFLTRY